MACVTSSERSLAQTDSTASSDAKRKWLHFPRFRVLLLIALGLLAVFWIAPIIAAIVTNIDFDEIAHPYAIIFGFVVLDAVIPIFPSESLLTTASNLAAQPGSDIELRRLIVAGSLGAIIGDSLLYWLSRTVLRRSMSRQVAKAEENPKIARSMEVMSRTAPLLIVFGRFVPGLRFIVGATMGLTKFSYPRLLLYDSIGGILWASYTCIFSYAVAAVIQDKPLVSILVSVLVTTGLLALLYKPLKKNWEATESPA